MSHGHGPPPPHHDGSSYGFSDLDYVQMHDMTGVPTTTAPDGMTDGSIMGDAFSMAGDPQGVSASSMQGLLDSTMMAAFGDIPMSLDANDDSMQSLGYSTNDGHLDDSVARSENQFNTAANNIPGAGPTPPGAFGQAILGGPGNTLTEFTKRRNWPAKVVEELKDFLQILDANGRIKYASPSILAVTGFSQQEIQDVFLKELIHPDDQGVFVSELNESIASGNPLRMFYRFKKKEGEYAIFETIGHAHIAASKFAPNPNNQSPFCQAVFMMARPYPTKNASLLDSFLEHKIENERLKRRIAELRREEEAEANEAQKQWLHSQDGHNTNTARSTKSDDTRATSTPMATPMSERTALNVALTRENLEGVVAGNRPDSLRDKMARYEGATHADTIEMLTGLRYIEGERSRGITTGNASPTLIKGDAGISIPVDRDPRTGEKKKKLKTSEEYVCTDCGNTMPVTLGELSLMDRIRDTGFARVEERTKWTQDALQCLRPAVGQEGEEEKQHRPQRLDTHCGDGDNGSCASWPMPSLSVSAYAPWRCRHYSGEEQQQLPQAFGGKPVQGGKIVIHDVGVGNFSFVTMHTLGEGIHDLDTKSACFSVFFFVLFNYSRCLCI
jgi:PAS domain S-box-containing protein